MDIIVLDGNQRSALAVTRSLGKRGLKVAVGEASGKSLASSSKYCGESFTYPSPYANPDGFLQTVMNCAVNNTGSVLFPMTDVTLSEVLKKKEVLGNDVEIPFADYERYIAVSDKVNLFMAARELKVPIPRTLFPSEFKDRKDLLDESKELGFPLVIKPASSRIFTDRGWINTSVRYAKTQDDLRAILDDEPFRSFPFLIQERIEGPGIGIFLLIHDGQIFAQFGHQRIREKPPSGGVSVLCESIKTPPIALNSAIRLLQHFNWAGVAMVEFKLDRHDNVPKLMEVNARFWGSLQLAISAGVDFPYLLYCMAKGEKVSDNGNYKIGIRSRWELGDLDHLLIRFKKNPSNLFLPPGFPSRTNVLTSFFGDFFKPHVKNEVLRFDDLGPFLFELKEYLISFIKRSL